MHSSDRDKLLIIFMQLSATLLTDVLTWVVVEQHQADISLPNSSGLSA